MTKSKAKDTTLKDFCDDLRTEILARLPVLALLRFKCVCKSWFALITSTSFIAKHFEVCNSNRNPNLLISNGSNYHIVYPGALEELQSLSYTIPHIPSVEYWPRMVGSCDGLACSYGRGVGIIWNPATRETMIMPPCSVQGSKKQAVGFGFDATKDDYKVCLIHLFHTALRADPDSDTEKDIDADSDSIVEWLKIEVYSLRMNSWKLITGIKIKKKKKLFCIVEEVGVYNKGVISWVAYGKRQHPDYGYGEEVGVAWKEEIISFDINKEVITRTPLPAEIGVHEPSHIHNYVGVKDGQLAVLNSHDQPMDHRHDNDLFALFTVWNLPEIGNKDSWEKSLAITRPIEWFSPKWVIWNGYLVCRDQLGGEYQPNTEVLGIFDIKREEEHTLEFPSEEDMDFVTTFRESLVSIRGRQFTTKK